jgi:L-asparagine transporter-like permease
MSLLTAVAICGGLVLSIVYGKHIVPMVYALLFGLGFISYLVIVISGTSDVVDDVFFEMIMLIFTLPLMSFMSIPAVLGADRATALLIIGGFITAISVAVAVYIVINTKREEERKKQEEAERIRNAEKAKAGMANRRRRKV